MPIIINFSFFFFFNDPATTEIYTLSLHDALPILRPRVEIRSRSTTTVDCGLSIFRSVSMNQNLPLSRAFASTACTTSRSEEHTSELQSQSNLVCRLLLEKKKTNDILHRLQHQLI